MNTIKSSKAVYQLLKENLSHHFEFIYLSTNILPIHRAEKINLIKTGKNPQIIVSTQLIEAGVDIDTDIVFRDFAPLDSIIQTAGRLNRNALNQTAPFYLYRLKDEKKEYCNYIYDFLLLSETSEILKGIQSINEFDLLKKIPLYYQAIQEKSSSLDAQKLLKAIYSLDYQNIQENFNLIDSAQKIDFFIEYDNQAKKIKHQYFKIIEEKEDPFQKKEKISKIKNQFQNYIISVFFTKELQGFNKNEINFVEKTYYDPDLGFTPARPEDMIL